MYGIINVTNVVDKLKPIDKLILMLACIGHGKWQINNSTRTVFNTTLIRLGSPWIQ
jgi:hypothetical protein